jgi:hypothetical protein
LHYASEVSIPITRGINRLLNQLLEALVEAGLLLDDLQVKERD